MSLGHNSTGRTDGTDGTDQMDKDVGRKKSAARSTDCMDLLREKLCPPDKPDRLDKLEYT